MTIIDAFADHPKGVVCPPTMSFAQDAITLGKCSRTRQDGGSPMKSFLFSTSMALTLTLLSQGLASAQGLGGSTPAPGANPTNRPFLRVPQQPQPSQPITPAPDAETDDAQVFQNGAVLPVPVDSGDEAPPAFLPNEPLEPYLLTRQAGPFMVAVHIFRGDYAVQRAQALAMELRAEHRLPSYVYFVKLKPGNSNVRDIPPTADREVDQPYVNLPESERVTDEAVVMAGNCTTIDQAKDLMKQVKKMKPRTMADNHSIFPWRNAKGLDRAFVTTNPLLPAQDLYPGRADHGAPKLPSGSVVDPEVLRSSFVNKVDPMVVRMNKGTPHSLYKCPAPYSLVVAEFSGRSALSGPDDSIINFPKTFEKSPLRTAHEDAENLASELSKHEVVRSLGVQPYVYHDRTSSRVFLGSYQTPDDPRIDHIRQAITKIEVETKRERDKNGHLLITRKHLAPGGQAFEVPRPE